MLQLRLLERLTSFRPAFASSSEVASGDSCLAVFHYVMSGLKGGRKRQRTGSACKELQLHSDASCPAFGGAGCFSGMRNLEGTVWLLITTARVSFYF